MRVKYWLSTKSNDNPLWIQAHIDEVPAIDSIIPITREFIKAEPATKKWNFRAGKYQVTSVHDRTTENLSWTYDIYAMLVVD